MTEIIGILMAIVVGYIIGYIANVIIVTYLGGFTGDIMEDDEIIKMSVFWPITFPVFVILIIGVLVARVSQKIIKEITERFNK